MKIINVLIRCILSLLLVVLMACSSGTVPGEDDPDGGGGGAGNGGTVSCGECPCVGDLSVDAPQSTICALSGTLTKSATLPRLNGRDWFIVNSITVESGTLTIEPGVEVFASRSALTSDPEYLYVMPGASIQAVGTSSEPIIFSSDDSEYTLDGSVSSTDGWSGIIIDTGSAPSANRLQYVIVAEAGLETDITSGPQDVSAGITLLGRHENTVMSYVQVHDTFGDGISIDGEGHGNVARMESMLVTAAGRDGIHYQDFSGLIKDVLIVHEAGAYNVTTNRGGRAGIRAGGMSSLPLLTGITMVGNDGTSQNVSGNREYALLFESSINQIRLVNSLLLNFKNGCYDIAGGADLSMVAIANAPLGSFVDGVHCVVEQNGGADIGDATIGNDFVETGSGNGTGLRFHNAVTTQFNSASSPSFSEAWRLESIDGLLNDPNPNAGAGNTPVPCAMGLATHLCLYNDGDTDNDGDIDSVDTDAGRFMDNAGDTLFDGLVQAGQMRFYVGPAPITDPGLAGFQFVNPSTVLPLSPQPTGFVAGFIALLAANGGFDLTEIGAVRSSNLNVFNNWTLQGGAVSPVVGGFLP